MSKRCIDDSAAGDALRFQHRIVRVRGVPDAPWLALRPIDGLARSVWVALASDGALYRVDLDAGRCDRLGTLPASRLDLAAPVTLLVDRRGSMAAVVNEQGSHGVVLDLESCRALMPLDRGDYHEECCRFPVAFFEHSGRTLLVHATDWNRLEVSDPRSGTVFTARDAMRCNANNGPPAHYLDYFHCGLCVSPEGTRVAEDGWVWQPMGVVRCWSLRHWLERNPYESEDGDSVREPCVRDFWDGPLCWLSERELAVWGRGEGDASVINAVQVFDADSGELLRWFAGPARGQMVFDRYLFVLSDSAGMTVWDAVSGERVSSEPGLHPWGYHRGAREFCTPLPGGEFRRSVFAGGAQ